MAIGNDIVDLRDPEAQLEALHPRFAARVCTAAELAALAQAPAPAALLWSYWAAKESAYKALRGVMPGLRFAPRQFAVELWPAGTGRWHGRVRVAGRQVRVRLRCTSDYVHALARVAGGRDTTMRANRLAGGARRVGNLSAAQSSAGARGLLTEALARRLGAAPEAIEIGRAPRRGTPPTVRIDGALVPIDVSLSHHGRFVAAAYAL